MPPEKKLPEVPKDAPKAEHKKHFDEFLQIEYHKKQPPGYKPTDEAKP